MEQPSFQVCSHRNALDTNGSLWIIGKKGLDEAYRSRLNLFVYIKGEALNNKKEGVSCQSLKGFGLLFDSVSGILKMDDMSGRNENQKTNLAVNRAINLYIQSRKEKVPDFTKRFFSLKGALRLNKKAFGTDLYKSPR